MGCFSGDVTRVANTRIFARATDHGTQVLVIQLDYAANGDIAMILPLPTPPGTAVGDVHFVDLSSYPTFFTDMANGFPIARSAAEAYIKTAPSALQVGKVEPSYSPSRAALNELEPHFRISDAVWNRLPEYGDYGFAVFKLSGDAQTMAPVAVEFPVRDPHLLFFPTVQVLGDKVEENAYFDHDLFCQANVGWMRSYDSARSFMDLPHSGELVDPNVRIERFTVLGLHPNSDIVMSVA